MKTRDVCRATMLTERAVRLYVSKGLCEPGQKNGLMDFSNEDIRRLRDIAALRRLDFSIDQIRRMIEEPGQIASVVGARVEEAQERIAHEQDVLDALADTDAPDMRELVRRIELSELTPPEPDFSCFDEYSAEEKERMTESGRADLRRLRRRRKWIVAAVSGALLAVVIGFFAMITPRIQRFCDEIPLPGFAIIENVDGEYLRIRPEGCSQELVKDLGVNEIEVALGLDTRMRLNCGMLRAESALPGAFYPADSVLRFRLYFLGTNELLTQTGRTPLRSYGNLTQAELYAILADALALPAQQRSENLFIELYTDAPLSPAS